MRWLGAALWTVLLVAPVGASELFRIGEVEGVLNLSVGYGLLARVEGRDADLVGIGNGGGAPSVNFDDGNLNDGRGIVASELRGTAEVALRWENFGALIRGYGFYDFENEGGDGRRTDLSRDGRRAVGRGAELQDAYLTANFDLRDVPIQLRLGNQLVNWGESRFLRFGVDVVNPVDLVALTQPATTSRDLFVRQGMLWGVANLTESVAVEAFYQFDWEPVNLPPVGWLFSADDLLGADTNVAFEGFGVFSDQGTDLDAAFDPTNQPLGFDPDFMKIFSAGRDEPNDHGQFGVAIQTLLPVLNSSKLSLYFMNYHSRLPLVDGLTADPARVASTSDGAVDARAATFGINRSDAELVALSDLANGTRYEVTYPEDIQMIGVGFSTATIATGTLIAAEFSHHFDWPVQVPREEVLTAALSPVEFTSPLAEVFRSTSLGVFGAGLVSLDIGWVYVDDLQSSSPFDADSWGYRLAGRLTYEGVLGAFTLRPALLFTHDVEGVTPGPGGAFVEERKTFTAALDVQYTQRWTASLSYVRNFGGVRIGGVPVNRLEDRDFVRFNLIFHYRGSMLRHRHDARLLAFLFALLGGSSGVGAAVSEQEADRLGAELTPIGAERAANAEGTIPAWTGGITEAPQGYEEGDWHVDPHPGDAPRLTISAANLDEHAHHLSEGQKALLFAYPETWRLRVYPTRRSASYPEWVYEAVGRNATNAHLVVEGKGSVAGARVSSPFPIPKSGVEVIWNHTLRFRGVRVSRGVGSAAVTRRGNYSVIVSQQEVGVPYASPSDTAFRRAHPNVMLALKSKVIAPSLRSGDGLLVIEPIDQTRDPRRAWSYSRALRRVLRNPYFAYDHPAPDSDGLRAVDELDLFNGPPDRFEWRLLGKRELYVPYNAYRLHGDHVEPDDVLLVGHIDPESARYELHRVWVVEGRLKAGQRHVYSRRVFYLDEDSWQILVSESYDSKGGLWRLAEAHALNYYDVPVLWDTLQVYHDLRERRYFVFGLDVGLTAPRFEEGGDPREFSPNALLYYVR
jgi:hypothetical protein